MKFYVPVTIDELMLRMVKNLERDSYIRDMENNKKLLLGSNLAKLTSETIEDAVEKSI
jgi:hypothetical protein